MGCAESTCTTRAAATAAVSQHTRQQSRRTSRAGTAHTIVTLYMWQAGCTCEVLTASATRKSTNALGRRQRAVDPARGPRRRGLRRTEQLLRVWIRGAAHQVHEQRVAANDAEVPAVAAPRPTRRRAARRCAVACGREVLLSVQERTERVVTQPVNFIVLPQDFASPGAQLRV
jgi:hypothetical protein